MIDGLFDGLLGLGLLWFGWRSMVSPDLFRAVILFVVFGLLMALCWARLGAPDLALAEAAIGAGITGALLLNAYRDFVTRRVIDRSHPDDEAPESGSVLIGVLSGGLVGGLVWALLMLPEPTTNPAVLVQDRLDETGVSNPVTAVLLNFRGYDTLLEMAVMLLALLGVWGAGQSVSGRPAVQAEAAQDSVLMDTLIRMLTPVAMLTAGYLLWAGAHAPGGAFQGGAVLAGIGVLLYLGKRLATVPFTPWPQRALLVLGPAVFSAVALGVMALGGNLLEYPQAWAGYLILVIESTLMVSIALILVLLFSGAPALRGSGR